MAETEKKDFRNKLMSAAKQTGAEMVSVLTDSDEPFDPSAEAKKTIAKGATATLVALSVLSGMAFSGPADITQDQISSQMHPTPVVMDIDDFVNTTVDDDDDDADEQKGAKVGVVAKFRQAVLSLPQAVRLLIITPLWAAGTALMTAVTFLWNVLFSSPLGAFIASFAVGYAVLFGLFAVTAKMIFPNVPLRKLLTKRNILALGISALVLSGVDAVAPHYWPQYATWAALVKFGACASVVALLIYRFKSFLNRNDDNKNDSGSDGGSDKYKNMPEPAF